MWACTCVGQDFQARSSCFRDSFCGHAGNNYTSEAVLLTGCIDLVVSEFNCSLPGIEPICKQLEIPMLCLDDVAKKKNARLVAYQAGKGEEAAASIAAVAIASFLRRGKAGKRTNPMKDHGAQEAL